MAPYHMRAVNLLVVIGVAAAMGCTRVDLKAEADKHNQLARQALKRKEYSLAVREATEALRYDSDYLPALSNRATALVELGDDEAALRDYDQAISLNPNFSVARFNRAFVWYERGNLDAALTDLNAALSSDPRYAPAYNLRAMVRDDREDHAGALADLDEAISLDPNGRPYRVNRGRIALALDEFEKAHDDYSRLIELEPENFDWWVRRSVAATRLGNCEDALVDADEAIRLNANSHEGFSVRAVANLVWGDYPAVKLDSEQALQFAPDDLLALRSLALALVLIPDPTQRDGRRAVELAQKSGDLFEWSNPDSFYVLAAAHAEARDFEKAVECQKKAIEMGPPAGREEEFANLLEQYESGGTYAELVERVERESQETP